LTSNVGQYSNHIQRWGQVLDDEGDILFYGCDVAASEDGQQLIQRLGELTNADVAASTDTTGHGTLGGDWVLEYRFGSVETDLPLDDDSQAAWQSTLDIAQLIRRQIATTVH